MSTTAVLDPVAAVRALSAELHDKLQELLDTTSRYDPHLLDKVRALSGSLGKRLTNARKRAEQSAEQPKPTASTQASAPAPAAKPTTPAPAAGPKPDRTPTPRVVPARMRPASDRPAAVTIPTRPPAPRGRHRATVARRPRSTAPVIYRPARALRRLPWLLVLAVLVLVGAAVAVATGQPLATVAGSAAAMGWLYATRTRVTPPVTRHAAVAGVAVVLTVTLLTVAVASGRTGGPPASPTTPPEVSVIGTAP